jgi:WD40 repeat protein
MKGWRRRQPATPAQTAGAEHGSAGLRASKIREMLGVELVQRFSGMEKGRIYATAWSPDGETLAATAEDGQVGLWALATGKRRIWQGHSATPIALAWHPTLPLLATGANDRTVLLWQTETGKCWTLCHTAREIGGVAWSPNQRQLAVYTLDGNLSLHNTEEPALVRSEGPYARGGFGLCWSRGGSVLAAGSESGEIIVCSGEDLQLIHRLKGHSAGPSDVALAPKGDVIASAGFNDRTVRIWNSASGQEVTILEGHRSGLTCVRFSPDGEFLASLSPDELRLWRCRDWECVSTVSRIDAYGVGGLDFHPLEPFLAAKGIDSRSGAQQVDCFKVDFALLSAVDLMPDSSRYVNAKVILLGDTGVGKSGLGLVLSGQQYEPTDSTHGRNVWMLDTQEVETPAGGKQTREILLWDLAGQPGYRLIHQLHLGEVAVALLVFDARSETDPFSGVKHWVRALAQARRLEGSSAVPLRAYLVAARADRGGVAVTRDRVRAMLDDLGLDGLFETSAKEGWRVAELAEAVRNGIVWEALPMVSSSVLFGSIKEFLLEEKEQGRLLSTVDDLFREFRRAQPDAATDANLRASFETCIGRVESRGLIRRLHFGGLVILQPELLDAYASAMVQAAKEEPDGLGFIPEQEALDGLFRLPEQERVADRGQEKLLLIATVEELLRHEIALKATTDSGVDLVFPSQFTRERPDAPDIPGKQAIFTFEGPLYSVYATLAVRLSHSTLFRRQAMWQNAAVYLSAAGGACGIHLRELEEGRGELALFFDEQAAAATRAQFETYVAEHLQIRAVPGTLTRREIRACPSCDFVLPEDLIERRVKRGATTIRCPACEGSVMSLEDKPFARAEAAVAEMNHSADDQRDRNVAGARLRGKIETRDYDVFLCYNSADRERVKAIGEQLKERGILPWLDIWEIRPGTRWQPELAKQIKSVKSAAVFIGPRGRGPWQDVEVETLLTQLVKRKCPIIPVILEGRQGQPQLPPFLSLLHLVDMRQPDPDPFRQLAWGITGDRSPAEF